MFPSISCLTLFKKLIDLKGNQEKKMLKQNQIPISPFILTVIRMSLRFFVCINVNLVHLFFKFKNKSHRGLIESGWELDLNIV